jgi:hypothetical protein
MTQKVDDLTAGDPRLTSGGIRQGTGTGQSLRDVTPGLDPRERVRSAALRAIAITRAVTHDVAAIIDKGVAAASAEARAAWKRWSPPKQASTPDAAPPAQTQSPPSSPTSPSSGDPPPSSSG